MERSLTQTHPNVWRLVADNPSPMTGPGTNTYLVGADQVVIIDPGPNQFDHHRNIINALQSLQATARAVIITHAHADHAGGAAQLAGQLGAPLLAFGDPLRHNDQIEMDGLTMIARHTPGHIHAHIGLWLAEQQLFFAGDLVAGQGTVLIIPPDGDMAAYLDSLRAMQAMAPAAILPGHGPVVDAPRQLLQQYIDHRLMREQQVLRCWQQGYTSAQAIAAQIYADRPEVLGIAALQVEAHLQKLKAEGQLK